MLPILLCQVAARNTLAEEARLSSVHDLVARSSSPPATDQPAPSSPGACEAAERLGAEDPKVAAVRHASQP